MVLGQEAVMRSIEVMAQPHNVFLLSTLNQLAFVQTQILRPTLSLSLEHGELVRPKYDNWSLSGCPDLSSPGLINRSVLVLRQASSRNYCTFYFRGHKSHSKFINVGNQMVIWVTPAYDIFAVVIAITCFPWGIVYRARAPHGLVASIARRELGLYKITGGSHMLRLTSESFLSSLQPYLTD